MDAGPYTGDLDLDAVSTRDGLAELLRTVHIRADKPSLRTLEARTRHSDTPLSKTVVAEMLKGARFPRKAVMVSFLCACGVADADMDLWQRTWERVAADQGATNTQQAKYAAGDLTAVANSPSADMTRMRELQDQVSRLSSDNDRLRAQLSVTQQQTVEKLRSDEAGGGLMPRALGI